MSIDQQVHKDQVSSDDGITQHTLAPWGWWSCLKRAQDPSSHFTTSSSSVTGSRQVLIALAFRLKQTRRKNHVPMTRSITCLSVQQSPNNRFLFIDYSLAIIYKRNDVQQFNTTVGVGLFYTIDYCHRPASRWSCFDFSSCRPSRRPALHGKGVFVWVGSSG